MSGAERLREAADRLDRVVSGKGEPWEVETVRTATLLRALIRWSPDSDNDRCAMCYRTGRHDDDCPVRLAGLLADTILGGTDA